MNDAKIIVGLMILPSALGLCGCHSMNRILYRAGTTPVQQAVPTQIILAVDFGVVQQEQPPARDRRQEDSHRKPDRTQPEKKIPADAKDAQDQELDDDERKVSEKQAARRYTEPGEPVRQQTLLAMGTVSAYLSSESDVSGAGKEASEALAGASPLMSTGGFVGRAGLTASQPTVAGAVVSRPGLQEGPATGLGFASPFNILTPQINPLSGVMGRCHDLTIAGFFGGNLANCERHFQR